MINNRHTFFIISVDIPKKTVMHNKAIPVFELQ